MDNRVKGAVTGIVIWVLLLGISNRFLGVDVSLKSIVSGVVSLVLAYAAYRLVVKYVK